MKFSLVAKVITLLIGSILTLGVAILGVTSYITSTTIEENIKSDLEITQHSIDAYFKTGEEEVKLLATMIASRNVLADAIASNNQPEVKKITAAIGAQQKEGYFLTVTDSKGNVLARSHGDKFGDSVTNQMNVVEALKGKSISGIEEGTAVPLAFRAGAPVIVTENGKDKIVGTVNVGFDLVKNHKFVDYIKSIYLVEATLFLDDTRVSTTIVTNGERAVGTKVTDPKVIETVYTKKQTYFGAANLFGRRYDSAYQPLKNMSGKVIGMLFFGKDHEAIVGGFNKLYNAIIFLVLGIGTLMTVTSIFGIKQITGKLEKLIAELSNSTEDITTAAHEMAETSQQIAQGASEQAANLEQVSAAILEVETATKNNADNTRSANDRSLQAYNASSKGQEVMPRMLSVMEQIQKSSEETAKIVKTINDIAFQTNLLALNAAVEAAGAGEAGSGFSIVADEVRNLAVRTADAAKNTAELINTSKEQTESGVKISNAVADILDQISQKANSASQLMTSVTESSKEQAIGVTSVSEAITKIDQVTQGNAAAAEESAASSSQVSDQVKSMKEVVSGLTEIVNGR